MTSKTALPVIEITSACPADWAAMTGDASRRFCDQCGKHVHNLSDLSTDAVNGFVTEAAPGTCVRFEQDEAGRVITLDYARPPRSQRRRNVLLASLALAGSIAASVFGYTARRPSRAGVVAGMMRLRPVPRAVTSNPATPHASLTDSAEPCPSTSAP